MLRTRVDLSSFRTFIVVVAALAVMAAVMSAVPSSAAPDPVAVSALNPSPDQNTNKGSASERGKAQAKARKTKKRVEVKGEQTPTTTLIANPDGTFSHEKAAAPVRAKDKDGKLAPIDTDLTQSGSSLEPKVTTGEVAFSGTGQGDLATYEVEKGATVSLGYAGALGAPATDGSDAVYPIEGSDTEEVKVAALPDGFVSHVLVSDAPTEAPTYTFTLKLDGLTAELKNNRLELSNAEKKVVAESRPLQMWDAARDEAGDPSNVESVEAKLVDGANGGKELQLTPSMKYLTDPKTQYPVTVDPDIAKVQDKGDTYYFNGQLPTDSRGSDYRLRTGYQDGATHRSLVTFSYEDYIGQTVTKATLKLRQYSSATCTDKKNEAYPIKADTAAVITWDTRPAIEDTARFRTSNTSNHGQSGCPDAFEDFDVTAQVSAWAGATLNSDTAGLNRQGIELRAALENDGSYDKRFCSANPSGDSSLACSTSAYTPVLSVTYAPELGAESFYSTTSHPLNDKSDLTINNKAGNALITANDGSVNALGMPFDLTRSYNSQSPATSSLGQGWNLGLGADVWIEKKSQYRRDYHAPDGTHFGSFVRETADSGSTDYDNFITPMGGVGADLNQDYDGNGSSDSSNDPDDPDQFNLTMHDSQMDYQFEEQLSTGHAYLSKVTDRSGNTMTFTYSGTTAADTPKLSTVTDTGGRTYAITYDASNKYITQVTEDSGLGRSWTYGYTGDYLTSYTDPDGKTTNYDYGTEFEGPDLVKTITNPANATGERPTTNLTYGQDSDLNVEEVITASYVLSGSITYQWTWDYHSSEDHTPVCVDHGDFSTEVFDPNGHRTTYCYKPREENGGKMKEWVYDGEGNLRDEDFNVDRQSDTRTTAGGGTSVRTYGASIPDQLKTVKDPTSGGTTGERTDVSHNHESGAGDPDPDGQDYLPSSVTDPNGDCTRYEYDKPGRPTAAITKLRGSGTNRSCADDTSGGVKYRFEYNSNGTMSKSADANSQTVTLDSEKTIYTYWASGDPGFVAGTAGLVKAVRKPGGNCSTTTSERKLCTSYTHDAAGRVKTVTDGRNIKTTMEYDNLDRTTKVLFNGATSCAASTDCITYTYDAEGNLTKRIEAAGDTVFTYDRMNRQLTRTQPDGVSMEMSYDGVTNMTQFKQTIDTDADPNTAPETDKVDYTYDKANVVDKITDTSGQINVNADENSRIEEIFFPGTGGLKFDLDFKESGKPAAATARTGGTNGPKLREHTYDYTDGDDDEDQLQSRVTTNAAGLNGTINYEYEYGRLDKATDSNGTDYDYSHDNIGNVASEQIGANGTPTHYGYDRAGQLCYAGPTDGFSTATICGLPPAGAKIYEHDAAGNNLNTTAEPTKYNDHSQVTELGGLDMKYLDLGNDLRTDVGGTQIVEGPMGISARKTGTQITWYTRMPDGTILNARRKDETTQTVTTQNYFTEPHNKSVAALYSPAGDKVGSYVYSPYGKTIVDNEGAGSIADDNPFRYISGYQDTEGPDDYYKLGARYYDTHGHFTQPDPVVGSISDPRTLTAYNYAAADPINHSDPSGNAYCPTGYQTSCWTPICFAGSKNAKWPGCNPPRARIAGPTRAHVVACYKMFGEIGFLFAGGIGWKTASRAEKVVRGGLESLWSTFWLVPDAGKCINS